MVLRECAYPEFKAGVSWHPSHSPISGLLGEEERELLAPVTCPQLFMPAQVMGNILLLLVNSLYTLLSLVRVITPTPGPEVWPSSYSGTR